MDAEVLNPNRDYASWLQLGGYFDGDGSLLIGNVHAPFYLDLRISFSDQSSEQIEMIRAFLIRKTIRVSKSLRQPTGAWAFQVSEAKSVHRMMRRLAPFTFKKSVELHAGISYYEDRITGNEFQAVIEREVTLGRRERRPHKTFDMPYFRSRGRDILLMRRTANSMMEHVSRRIVSPTDKTLIKEARLQGLSWSELHSVFPGYSTGTLRRVVSGLYEEVDAKLKSMLAQTRTS